MNYKDLQEYKSAKRMTAMMTVHDLVFKDNEIAMNLKAALITNIAELDAIGAARVSARGKQTDGTADKNAAEDALEKFIRKIVADAKIIKKAESHFDNTFKIPSGSFSVEDLIAIGRAFVKDLTPATIAKFAAYGSPSITAANIEAKIDAVEAGSVEQNSGMGASIAATGATNAIMKLLKENRSILKGVGVNILEQHGDAGLIAEWDSACRVEKKKPKTVEAKPAPALDADDAENSDE